jgi:hypothetical protein
VFVDASVEPEAEVEMKKLFPAESSQIFAHAADPRTLLAMARDLFGHVPEAWCLSIPVENLDIGGRAVGVWPNKAWTWPSRSIRKLARAKPCLREVNLKPLCATQARTGLRRKVRVDSGCAHVERHERHGATSLGHERGRLQRRRREDWSSGWHSTVNSAPIAPSQSG